MSYILSIETSGQNCSVALHNKLDLLDILESKENNKHAEKLAPFVKQILERNELAVNDLSAIAVSEGPGSYTGLRIGVSLAKGICYASELPLIAIDTLKSLAFAMKKEILASSNNIVLMPMIDARRMEVYTASYDMDLEKIKKIEPVILEDSFYESLSKGRIYFIAGSGAQKLNTELIGLNLKIMPHIELSAKHLGELAFLKFEKKEFEDPAYFEPVYLKEFAMLIKKTNPS